MAKHCHTDPFLLCRACRPFLVAAALCAICAVANVIYLYQ